jgi:putative transposase
VKYQFIEEHKHEHPIALMCRVFEISVSGYYAWGKRPASRHDREDAKLAEQVKTVFEQHQRR